MASWTNNNSSYYINPAHLTFVENSGYGANLIQVSASSSCYISVFIPGVIGYSDADKNYRRWKVTAYNNKFPDNSRFYIYVRLEKDGTSALIVYDKVLRGVHGGEIIEKTDDKGNVTREEGGYDEKHAYYYIHIGEVSGTDGSSIREIAYDTGYLTSDMSQNDKGGLNDMWELDKHSTPWLIRAKQWLQSFTVKGFVTLIGGLIFKKGDQEKPVVDIKRSVDDDVDVPISDDTVPTTEWVKSMTDDRYLKRYEPDETHYRIKFFDGIEAGHYVKGMVGGNGTILDGQGYGEMNGLTLREFLEVPELRFNRIDVVSGELWNSIAFGLVESVDTEKRICHIKLEERERCGLHVYDICRGIFADFGDGTQWEGVDECGFMHLYGFWTAYFTPTKILTNGEGMFSFQYELKPGTTRHPVPSMKFAVYGNFVDPSRRASAYSTRTYKRYLNKVDTWVIDPDKHIYAQYGDLNGLTIGGMVMEGYGSYQHNCYFTGTQIEFTPQQKLELQGESAYTAVLSDYEGIVTIDDEGNVVGGDSELLNVVTDGHNVVTDGKNVVTSEYRLRTEVIALRGSAQLFYSPISPGEGSYTISIQPVGCTAMVLNGIVVVTSVFHTERCFVTITVNCEGKASFQLTYRITAVRDGRNPIIADIDNEMDSVACDSSGKVIFGLPVNCTVSMWAGSKPLVLEDLTVSAPDGVSCTASRETGVVSVTSISDEAERTLPVNIRAYASYGGTQYHKDLVFTVNKVNAGENALLYKLSPSASSVKVDDEGNMTATAISCKVVESNGSGISELKSLSEADGLTMKYYVGKNEPSVYTYGSDVAITGVDKTVTFQLYYNEALIDVETIPILVDGSSPFIVDLDNEMHSVACDENGAVLLGLPISTGVKAYCGSKELSIKTLTVGPVQGVTASNDGNVVTVSAITASSAENLRIPITVTATHDKDYTRTVYLVINKIRQGNSAVVLDLTPSASAIKVSSSGSVDPSSMYCTVKRTTGKNGADTPASLPFDYKMSYAIDGIDKGNYAYGSIIGLTDKNVKINTSITFCLYYKDVLVDRETVPVIKDAVSSFKSTVFIRSNENPGVPSGGSYDSPKPTSTPAWSDGVPEGEAILWASVCTFSNDGTDSGWSYPRPMTDTASFDMEWSSVEDNPGTPASHPENWGNTPDSSTVWVAINTKKNGNWQGWQVVKIKGETGATGATGDKGDTGASAEFYEIKAAVATIGYTMTGGYSPSSFVVSEYHVKGASREPSNKYWMFIYGVNTAKKTFLTSTDSVQEYTFNAGKYLTYDFDSFLFELRDADNTNANLVDSTSVAVSKQGRNGAMPRYCGFWDLSKEYVYDDNYRDIVVYKNDGQVYQVLSQGSSLTGILPSDSSKWEKANKNSFMAMDTALVDNANIAGFTFRHAASSSPDNPVGIMESQNGTLKLDSEKGELTALAGNIGGFEIGKDSLVNTDGKAYIHMESMDKRHDVRMGGMFTHAGAEFSSVGGSASYFYASGSGACCLEVIADGSAKAVHSEGHAAMFTRYSSGQMVRISGLSLCTQQAASFSKTYTDDDFPAGAWVDFLVMTGDVSLPAPSNSKNGKVVFVRCNPSYTLTVPSGVDADGGSGTSFKDGKTRFFICDGIQWHEFYCGS